MTTTPSEKDLLSTNRRPDVAIFISSMEGGGAERAMRDLANGFVDLGLRTDLLLTRAVGPYLDELDTRVRLVDFDTRRPIWAFGRLVRYLNREQPRTMLSALDHTNLIAVAAARLARVNVRHVASQRRDPSDKPRIIREPKEVVNHLLLGFGLRRVDAVTAVSEGVARSVQRMHSVPRDRIRVIYNGVAIPTTSVANTVPDPWIERDESPILLAAGRLAHVKGFDVLLRAFRRVRNDRPARLIILGDGREEPHLKRLGERLGLSRDILFPGFVPDPLVWMRYASVFVLSSRSEGLPGVLIQAMACGVPVVSTSCPSGPNEILEDGKWGRLVEVGNAEALAEAIIETLDDPHPPPVLERARDFDPTTTLMQYVDVLGLGAQGQSSETKFA